MAKAPAAGQLRLARLGLRSARAAVLSYQAVREPLRCRTTQAPPAVGPRLLVNHTTCSAGFLDDVKGRLTQIELDKQYIAAPVFGRCWAL